MKQNVFLIGPMGVGKTSVGRALAKKLGLAFFDSDQYVEQRSGAPISWIFDVEGDEGFRQREETAIQELSEMSNIVLSTGGGSILSPANRKNLKSHGVIFFLYTDLQQQYVRTRRDEGRPLLQTENVKQKILELWRTRLPIYSKLADHRVDTTDKSIKQICDEITAYLKIHER